MSSLLVDWSGLGRQLKYSSMGRRDSVGSTGGLGLGCFGRTHAISRRFLGRADSLLLV